MAWSTHSVDLSPSSRHHEWPAQMGTLLAHVMLGTYVLHHFSRSFTFPDLTWGSAHTPHSAQVVCVGGAPETCVISLTSVAPINAIKRKKRVTFLVLSGHLGHLACLKLSRGSS